MALVFGLSLLFACTASAAAKRGVTHETGAGSAQVVTDLSGNRYTVAALGYRDPARPANSFLTAPAGTRLVAVQLRITNSGRANISGDVNNYGTIVGSNSQIYQAAFDDVSGCTNFNYGQFNLAHGGSVVGCVVFEIPRGVRPVKFIYDASDGFGGTRTATWRLT